MNAGPQRLFSNVTLTDPEGFAGGVLQVAGRLAEDKVLILDGGTGVGMIGLWGAFVT